MMKTTTRILTGLILFSLHAHGMELRDLEIGNDSPPSYRSLTPSLSSENQELQNNEQKKEPLFPRCIPDKGVPKPERIGDIVKFDLGPTPEGVWRVVYERGALQVSSDDLRAAIEAHVRPMPSELNVNVRRRSCLKRLVNVQPTMPDLTTYADNLTGIPEYLDPDLRQRIREAWLALAEKYVMDHDEEFIKARMRNSTCRKCGYGFLGVFLSIFGVGIVFTGPVLGSIFSRARQNCTMPNATDPCSNYTNPNVTNSFLNYTSNMG